MPASLSTGCPDDATAGISPEAPPPTPASAAANQPRGDPGPGGTAGHQAFLPRRRHPGTERSVAPPAAGCAAGSRAAGHRYPRRKEPGNSLSEMSAISSASSQMRSRSQSSPCKALAIFNRFPALFERSQVPALAFRGHDPETAPRRIEGQPPPDREQLHDLVGPQRLPAEHVGGVHGGPCWMGDHPHPNDAVLPLQPAGDERRASFPIGGPAWTSPTLPQELLGSLRQEQLVRDIRDLLGFFPGALQ